MFKIAFAVVAFSLILFSNAFSYIDAKCMLQCTSAQHTYGFCEKQCSYGIDSSYHRIDGKCYDKCCADGFDYMFCQEKCSY